MARGFAARSAVLAAALAVLGGCSMFDGNSVPCPSIGVLDYAGTVTRLDSGGAGDTADIEFRANIASLAADCSFDGETRTGSVELDIDFRARRGPADSATKHSFGYIVGVVDPEGEIAARTAFSVKVGFDGNDTETERTEKLTLTVPVKENASFAAYRIHVGMKLTKEQLDRNLGG